MHAKRICRSDCTLDLHLPILLFENLCERRGDTFTVDVLVWVGTARVLKESSIVFLKELSHLSVAVEGKLVHDKVERDLLISNNGVVVLAMMQRRCGRNKKGNAPYDLLMTSSARTRSLSTK